MTIKEKVIDIIDWAEGKWTFDEGVNNIIVEEIKKMIKEEE